MAGSLATRERGCRIRWARVPLVWILKGPKAGDYAQLQLLARALGCAGGHEATRVSPWELLLHACPRPTLAALDRATSDVLDAPWPDLVLTAGRRNELVARWIRDASGGRSRDWFTSDVRGRIRVSSISSFRTANTCSMTRRQRDRQRSAADRSHSRRHSPANESPGGRNGSTLPHPWTVVLVGGDSGPLVLSPTWARELARQVNARNTT